MRCRDRLQRAYPAHLFKVKYSAADPKKGTTCWALVPLGEEPSGTSCISIRTQLWLKPVCWP